MRLFIRIIINTVLFVFLCQISFAQEIRVNAVLDSSKIRIGEQVKLDLYVQYNPNQTSFKIQWPSIGDTLTQQVEVVSVTPIDTTIPDKNNPSIIQQHQQLIISAYDSGYFAIPPFKFIINNDTSNIKYTEALLLEVHTIPTDSSAKKLKDIKPPLNEPFNWKWYLDYAYWGIAALVIIIGVIFLFYYLRKRKKKVIIEPEKPKIPAHITALAALEKIKEEKIWKDNKFKEYYSGVSDTLRLYLEERFNVPALESTSDEIIAVIKNQVIDPVSKEKLIQILLLSDLVKFAKMIPIEHEHEITLQNAFDFVNGTKREEEYKIEEPSTELTT